MESVHARSLVVALLAATLSLAGCVDTLGGNGEGAPGDPLEPQNRTDETGEDPSSQGEQGDNTSGEEPQDRENRSDPPPSSDRSNASEHREHAPGWPSLDEASVRPGVRVFVQGGQCTSNFLFRSLDNTTLYLGTAAHCVAEGPSNQVDGCSDAQDPMPLGTEVRIQGANEPGTLVYSSWLTMQETGEDDEDTCRYNDFALIALDDETRDQVHPAMLHFGGPEALADYGAVTPGDKVLSYGNSGLRAGVEQSNWHEGYVISKTAGWSITTYTVAPGVPGDSGSGVLTGDGQALGIVSTVELAPRAGSNGVTALEPALAYAEEHGAQVELVTWEVLNQGILP